MRSYCRRRSDSITRHSCQESRAEILAKEFRVTDMMMETFRLRRKWEKAQCPKQWICPELSSALFMQAARWLVRLKEEALGAIEP